MTSFDLITVISADRYLSALGLEIVVKLFYEGVAIHTVNYASFLDRLS